MSDEAKYPWSKEAQAERKASGKNWVMTEEEVQQLAYEIADFYMNASPEERAEEMRWLRARWYEKVYG